MCVWSTDGAAITPMTPVGGYGSRRSPGRQKLFLPQRAGRIGWPKSFLAGTLGENLVIIPPIFRLFRRLDLDQPQIVHHQAVLAQLAVAGEKVLDRFFPHLCRPL